MRVEADTVICNKDRHTLDMDDSIQPMHSDERLDEYDPAMQLAEVGLVSKQGAGHRDTLLEHVLAAVCLHYSQSQLHRVVYYLVAAYQYS